MDAPIHMDSKNSPSDGGVFVYGRVRYGQGEITMSMNMIFNIGAFAVLSILWLGFGAALVFNQPMLDTVWQALRGLPLIFQGIVWLLALPVTLGLWVWESAWPLWIRLLLVIGLGFATIYTFFPKQG
jgi:hypothetical protein